MPTYLALIDGLALPARLSGHPALDFCNTGTGWNGGARADYLESYDHLAVWAGFVELLGRDRVASLRRLARRDPATAAAVLDQARAVRDRLYEVLLRPADAPEFAAFAEDVQLAAAHARLSRVVGSIGWEIDSEAGLAAPLLAATGAGVELLLSDERARIRACPGRECGWLFLDRSGRRRWCTMSTCGNREKARRFASRQRG
jgi:predicted RNA-binding Zn ribbon-like protein